MIYKKLGNTQVETIWKIEQAFGNDAISITCFKDGNYKIVDIFKTKNFAEGDPLSSPIRFNTKCNGRAEIHS